MTPPTQFDRLASRGNLHAAFERVHETAGCRSTDGTWNNGQLALIGLMTFAG
jgi:hypothetical protein